jgi:hypothetical protein
MFTHSPNKPKKFKKTLSAKRLMELFFCHKKGVLMVEFMQCRTTITSYVYCESLKEVRKAIQNKNCGMLTSGLVLLHDNARPHTSASARSRAQLEHFKWELFDHPLYSPDQL